MQRINTTEGRPEKPAEIPQEEWKMYLSELFLQSIENDAAMEKVKDAIRICEEELRSRPLPADDGTNGGSRLPETDGWDVASDGRELLDFWDVYREFDVEMDDAFKNSSKLLGLCRSLRLEPLPLRRRHCEIA